MRKNAPPRAPILWVEAGYLSPDEAGDLHRRIDAGIEAVEKFLALPFSRAAYGQEKIEFFIHSRRAPSHTITGYRPREYMHPVVFLSYAKRKRTPYLHETVHIIAWDWNSLWLKEGLAVHLNDSLGGYAAFPNFGESVDDFAGRVLRREFPRQPRKRSTSWEKTACLNSRTGACGGCFTYSRAPTPAISCASGG